MGVARAPHRPARPSRRARALLLPLHSPLGQRAQAALRIAHAGGAAVFVGWGSGLPLAAGTRAARVSRVAAR